MPSAKSTPSWIRYMPSIICLALVLIATMLTITQIDMQKRSSASPVDPYAGYEEGALLLPELGAPFMAKVKRDGTCLDGVNLQHGTEFSYCGPYLFMVR